MRQRTRKFIGMWVLVAFVIVYSLTAMLLASIILPDKATWVQIVYYMVAGFLWVIPCAPLITWMQKPNPGEEPR
ncbi:MAG: DUF2842 domain-containing protein [Hyphomicrobiales bacterium]|nr:MAG: DUF2842 domain-containing protein [Hyphomicrobiales bacterium]